MTALIILIVGTLNVACFLIGAKIGQKVARDETIVLPELNPMKLISDIRQRKEETKAQREYDTILENIDNYDGTSAGQKDVK